MEVNGILVAASELKEPVLTIRQLALSWDLAENLAERRSLQNGIVRISEKMAMQINDLMQIPRLSLENFPLETVSVRAVCEEAKFELKKAGVEFDEDFRMKISNQVGLVIANDFLLKRIIFNLCVNASMYREYGGNSGLFVEMRKNLVRVRVRDNGPFVPDKTVMVLKRGWMSEPVKMALRPDFSGTSLMICADFAKYLQTEVKVIQHVDGASFFVELPLSKQVSLF